MKRIAAVFLIILLVLPVSVFAQRKATQKISPKASPTYNVSFEGAPKNAVITVNGKNIDGNSINLKQGKYTVIARANGYFDFQTEIFVDSNSSIYISMQAMTATIKIQVPNNSSCRVFIDNRAIRNFTVDVRPGRHSVRIEIGELVAETSINTDAGRTYRIKPALGLSVN